MRIFDYDNFRLTLNKHEILLIPEFLKVMESDSSKDKKEAFKIFTYCYLLVDWQSPYAAFSEEEKQFLLQPN